jgi:hypothetical protein
MKRWWSGPSGQRLMRGSSNGDIVVVGGVPFGEAGTTNNLRVIKIGRGAVP